MPASDIKELGELAICFIKLPLCHKPIDLLEHLAIPFDDNAAHLVLKLAIVAGLRLREQCDRAGIIPLPYFYLDGDIPPGQASGLIGVFAVRPGLVKDCPGFSHHVVLQEALGLVDGRLDEIAF